MQKWRKWIDNSGRFGQPVRDQRERIETLKTETIRNLVFGETNLQYRKDNSELQNTGFCNRCL